VQDIDPGTAQNLANGLADAFVEKIEDFEPSVSPQPGALPQLPAYVYERATLPTTPAPTGLARRVILGGLFGLVAAIAVVFLLEYLDVTIKTAEDAERKLELQVLGVIPLAPQLNLTKQVRASPASVP
jgi:polysaccharide biosynthesis transport protein